MKPRIGKINLHRLLAALILLVTLTATEVRACHFAAADIFVTYVGTGVDGCGAPDYEYEITLKVYHACQTCNLEQGLTANVTYRSANAGVSVVETLNTVF